MNPETPLMRAIMFALSRAGAIVFRNSVGGAATASGGWVEYGLCKGSSDLIGWNTVTITPDMVGQRVAVFLACEVKRPKKQPTTEQKLFIRNVLDAGGIAFRAESEEDAVGRLEALSSWPF